MAPERKTDMRRMLRAKLLTAVTGESIKARHFAMLIAVKKIVIRRAIFGNAVIQ